MKYILLFLALTLNSCTCMDNAYVRDHYKIIHYESMNDSQCVYTAASNTAKRAFQFNTEDPKFVAKKGLYNIGDTIKFCR